MISDKNHGKQFSKSSGSGKSLSDSSLRKNAPDWGFIVLLLIYAASIIFVLRTSASDGVIILGKSQIPHRSLTGAFSSLSNLCVILLVVLYRKPGFFLALVLSVSQFPGLLLGIIVRHNFTSIPGIFTSLLNILALFLIYRNQSRVINYQLRLRTQAATEPITGLPNRFALFEHMSDLESRRETFAVAILNLNHFKSINNTMGQQGGDNALLQISSRWCDLSSEKPFGTKCFLASLGGNEFSLTIRHYRTEENLLNLLKAYESKLEEKISVDGCDFFVTSKIGYAIFPDDASDSETLFNAAYTAMVEAKHVDQDKQICRFSPAMLNADHSIETERKIRDALKNGRLYFNLQPQFDLSHNLRGFEALARMKDSDGNIISPNEFIPVAEKTGLIDQIDHEVFRSAAEFLGSRILRTRTDAILSVNVSVRHLLKNDFCEEVRCILEKSSLPAEQLEIEITESIMIDSMEKALECISRIEEMGVRIAIDDFGTGYSSLSYLKNLPVDVLKVDKSFVDQMNTGESSRQYIAAIIAIGHVMKYKVIAEGVETEDQLDTLRSIGCDYIQGFIWGRPLSPEDADRILTASVS